jgi:hypothetical protein
MKTDSSFTLTNSGINALKIELKQDALPIELTSFTAVVITNDVHLNWKTATEVNNNRFDIERMMENNAWQNIGSLAGAGNSNSPKSYSFIDNSPLSIGKYSYRLKQVDNDGNYKYSSIVEIDFTSAPNSYSLEQNYPNPFNPSTTISYGLPNASNVSLKIYNILGEQVASLVNKVMPAGYQTVVFDASKLASGMYIYRLEAGSFVQVKKMMMLK